MRRIPLAALILAALAVPPSASAGSGGAEYVENGAASPGETPLTGAPTGSGDGGPAGPAPALTHFSVSTKRLYLYGRPARVRFAIASPAASVQVSLSLRRTGSATAPRTIELGERATGVQQTYRLTGREGGRPPEGEYQVRIVARDAAGRGLRRGAGASSSAELSLYGHRFPLSGAFTYSGPDGRFGAARPGRAHQGQDLIVSEGVPVVAPRGGRVKAVGYQAEGAGHYLIIDGAGERLDYAFFHLQAGSIRVSQGQRVRPGARIASVGNTGRSFGAHLHFEIWRGPWFAGGQAIDPLPLLRDWDSWS